MVAEAKRAPSVRDRGSAPAKTAGQIGRRILEGRDEAARNGPAMRAEWIAALAAYHYAEAHASRIPIDDSRGDPAVESVCNAMDHLIEGVRAPDMKALSLKLSLALARAEPFTEPLFTDHAAGIIADIKHLATFDLAALDPHPVWLADRNRLYTIANEHSPMSDDLMGALNGFMNDIEKRIVQTPAATPEGWIAKAVMVLRLQPEGFQPNDEDCGALLNEAAAVLAIGDGDPTAILQRIDGAQS